MIRYDALFDLFGGYDTCKTLRRRASRPSLVTELDRMHSRRVHARTHARHDMRAYT